MALEITDVNFETEVIKSDKPVLVDFWASWCGPCKMMTPVIETAAQKHADTVKIGKLNVDDNPDTARNFGITAIPTLILFADGKEKKRHVGLLQEDSLDSFLKENLA
ncbi:MAG: thioredoxin [Chloroflexi bacterium]|nr:thioredoxin [Chloroflexota bacterium]